MLDETRIQPFGHRTLFFRIQWRRPLRAPPQNPKPSDTQYSGGLTEITGQLGLGGPRPETLFLSGQIS
jgi:hypothetical protein